MIVFVAAESREFRGIARHLQGRRRLQWPVQFAISGELSGRKVVLVGDGPGPDLAAHAADVAAEHGEVQAVVSTGFCGGLDPELPVGKIVIASAIVDRAGNITAETAMPVSSSTAGNAAVEKVLSVNRVAVTVEEKRMLRTSGAGAIEMEAAGVSNRARKWGAPFYGIRVVTDTATEGFGIDFNRMRDLNGRFRRSMIIKEACHDPFKLFPELMQFERRCRGAATVLGDFIADCQF